MIAPTRAERDGEAIAPRQAGARVRAAIGPGARRAASCISTQCCGVGAAGPADVRCVGGRLIRLRARVAGPGAMGRRVWVGRTDGPPERESSGNQRQVGSDDLTSDLLAAGKGYHQTRLCPYSVTCALVHFECRRRDEARANLGRRGAAGARRSLGLESEPPLWVGQSESTVGATERGRLARRAV